MSLVLYEQEFEQRLNQCWLSVMAADVLQLGNGTGWRTVSRDVRAGAVVMAVAEFEALLKDCVEETHSIIESSGVTIMDLRNEVRMLHHDTCFQAASGSSLDSAWSARRLLAGAHQSRDSPRLPRRDPNGFIQPLGSQTPKPAMLTRLWSVYDLPGQPFPQLAWRKSLGELAELRNDVAHRRLALTQALAGKARTADAVAAYVLDLRDLGKHVAQSLGTYTLGGGYLA